ncbi:hypothetical protein CJ030_MR8G028439 [Morella rubra]|uniref:PGG domain-containing protein n=1 Tax=Morella rubra TaxID=262757 RepID=A0A6A1URX7_9ROSI|nr:hypothetical protein CJ030_MR8G028439 [Morella rubra]
MELGRASEGTERKENGGQIDAEDPETQKGRHQESLPANYNTCYAFGKLGYKAILIVLGLGSATTKKIQEKKRKHTWALQVMNKLLEDISVHEYAGNVRLVPKKGSTDDPEETVPYGIEDSGSVVKKAFMGDDLSPRQTADSVEIMEPSGKDMTQETAKTAIAITFKNGVASVMEKIPDIFPVVVQSRGKKDIMLSGEMDKRPEGAKAETPILIAAKNGVTEIVEKVLERFPVAIHDTNVGEKNAVLLAVENRQPHVYQLLREKVVTKDSVFRKVNNEWNSALHLAAKFGDSKPWRIPGEALQMQWELKWYEFVKDSMPFHFFPHFNKHGKTSKDVFTETHKELVKSAVVMFLAILTSRFQPKDFGTNLPWKLLMGLTSLFLSIAAILMSFCAGHFFVLKDKLKYWAFPVYAVTCLPVSFFAMAQFSLYVDLLWAIIKKVPQCSYKAVPI